MFFHKPSLILSTSVFPVSALTRTGVILSPLFISRYLYCPGYTNKMYNKNTKAMKLNEILIKLFIVRFQFSLLVLKFFQAFLSGLKLLFIRLNACF